MLIGPKRRLLLHGVNCLIWIDCPVVNFDHTRFVDGYSHFVDHTLGRGCLIDIDLVGCTRWRDRFFYRFDGRTRVDRGGLTGVVVRLRLYRLAAGHDQHAHDYQQQ